MPRFWDWQPRGKLVHAAGLLQNSIIDFTCRTKDHALSFYHANTVRRTPGNVCS